MAATDKTLRDQRTLDIVFAVSNILMLVSIVWMMWQDYAREYKTEQREFRTVESAMAQRAALEMLPKPDEFKAAEDKVKDAKDLRDGKKKGSEGNPTRLRDAKAEIASLKPKKEKAEAAYQAVKADVDSINSFLSIALEHNEKEAAERFQKQLNDLTKQLAEKQETRDTVVSEMKQQQLILEEIEGPYTKASAEFKKVSDKLDTQVKLALTKRWTIWDSIRNIPVIDGFAAPVKIHQFTINDIPIDYNFKYVTRFDRCMSCHIGIDRPAYTAESLQALTTDASQANLDKAIEIYKKRVAALDPKDAASIPNPGSISLIKLDDRTLSPSRIREFAAHPRLDLFVGANSKHPAEKFGCSSCHYGQGSGTSFMDSSHTPNDSKTREAWVKDRHWEANHMWDFPMLPTRFIESSCIKCHHEVTDLISTDNRVEAPKVLRGFNLIKENGCFGCHEISGWKSGNRIGPDLRLEPNPPLEDLIPAERQRVLNDPDNRPGNLRKVGPALKRLSEKVDPTWIEKWLYSPATFRPDTKMPHYYNLSTNDADALKGTGQEKFPNTEIASIAYFLNKTSKDYLASADALHKKDGQNAAADAQKDMTRLEELINNGRLSKEETQELAVVKMRMKLRKETKLVDLAPNHKGDAKNGQILFIERGCLSCHTHQGTEDKNLMSEATFGPNLSQLPAKLGKSESARTWLIQWIMDPQIHSPRSRMPQTHLTAQEAADVAAWLLGQEAKELGAGWDKVSVTQPTNEEMQTLARVYLVRMLSESDMKLFFKGVSRADAEKLRKKQAVDPAVTVMYNDLADDEKRLFEEVTDDNTLKYYLGKKAVGRLGCFGCHDIPGFENVKSIGVGLNDWGKKPADRLAFEDIGNFFDRHYYSKVKGADGVETPINSLLDKNGKPAFGAKVEKIVENNKEVEVRLEPYEQFFAQALLGHNHDRIGYLNQKIRDPRSYDFNRIRTWDDRARMPKFTFSRPRKTKDEADADFEKRNFADEAAAREAVATFVLGLTAEQVPAKMTNSAMTPERMAEVKGRQILDKYNCNGCHLIRPGVYDFKPTAKALGMMVPIIKAANLEMDKLGEIRFLNHHNWIGRNAAGADTLTARAVYPRFNNDDPAEPFIIMRLTEALRVAADKKVINGPSSIELLIPPENFSASIKSQADFDRLYSSNRAYGGTFSDLLVPYLIQKDKNVFKPLPSGDSDEARASLPPSLIGQGERTQGDWLYRFLLDPTKIRRKAILRMPKFNLTSVEGNDEAKMLVDYFAGVSRQTNPGVALPHPFETTPAQGDLDSPYWQKRTADYVALLKKDEAVDKDGKKIKGMTSYDQRVAEYTPLWEKVSKEKEAALNADLEKLKDINKAREKQIKEKETLIKADKTKEAELRKEIDTLQQAIKDSETERKRINSELKQVDVKSLQRTWEEKEAYATDAYRLLTSRDLCSKCHQIGGIIAGDQVNQGPPLDLTSVRLRPEWVVRWVDKPHRFVPYASLMPMYFDKNTKKFQHIHGGEALEQIQALRDVLMNYPRVSSMPVNRMHNPDLPPPQK